MTWKAPARHSSFLSIEPSAQIVLRAEIGELQRLRAWLEPIFELYQLPSALSFQLDLCLTELVTNVISYGFPGTQPPEDAIAVRLVRGPAEVTVEVVDQGVEFNPVAYAPPPQPSTLEEARIGGRGLLLVRRFATQLQYRREQGCNRLTLRLAAQQNTV